MDSRDMQPEILDGLSAEDPRAIASRRDLRLIDAFMGNYAWLADELRSEPPCTPIAELGAGDGGLANYRQKLAQLSVTGFDLRPSPAQWAASWHWEEGDLLQPSQLNTIAASTEVIAASLFIHHLDREALMALGAAIQSPNSRVRRLLFAEPARNRIHSLQGYLLYPLGINDVTRHDLHASIRAGFRKGELARGLELDPQRWRITETRTFFGSFRFEAVLNPPA